MESNEGTGEIKLRLTYIRRALYSRYSPNIVAISGEDGLSYERRKAKHGDLLSKNEA